MFEFIKKFSGNICKAIKKLSSFTSAIFPSLKEEPPVFKEPLVLPEKALESNFNSRQEVLVKKGLAGAICIAKRLNVLPESIDTNVTATQISSIADEAVTRAKAAYQVGAGMIDSYEAADRIIDRATARVSAISDRIVSKGIGIAINKIGTAITAAIPAAAPVVAVVKFFQPLITEKCQKFVRKGIEKINSVAKKVVRKIASFGKKVINKLKSIFA